MTDQQPGMPDTTNKGEHMNTRTIAAVSAYIASIVAANLLVAHYGPSITVLNAFALIGLDLVLRDHLHDAWRGDKWRMAALIASAGALSYLLNPATGRIAAASTVAFTLAAVADWTVYALAHRQPWMVRSNASNIVGAAVDSITFPTLAFGALLWPIVIGQFIAKTLGGAAWSAIIAAARRGGTHAAADNIGA